MLWAACYGLAAFCLGQRLETFTRPLGLVLLFIGITVVLVSLWFIRRHEADLTMEADRALPGRLKSRRELRRAAS